MSDDDILSLHRLERDENVQRTCVGKCLKWKSRCTGAVPISWPKKPGSSGTKSHHGWRRPRLQWMVMASSVPCHVLHSPQSVAEPPSWSLDLTVDLIRTVRRRQLRMLGWQPAFWSPSPVRQGRKMGDITLIFQSAHCMQDGVSSIEERKKEDQKQDNWFSATPSHLCLFLSLILEMIIYLFSPDIETVMAALSCVCQSISGISELTKDTKRTNIY
ncbi:uncharacterized protein LOC142829096 isoform X1 [Pelodiscus sinensis]|uniref:uncharacterized protein LOC142829096 isoform X1 n=2 Tax=Pelodiscus sinensis TaxID=13735 RepID=UPI003F6CA2E3